MAKTRIIGDIHGYFRHYQEIIKDVDRSIQVGDYGMGFGDPPVLDTNHRFIRGNHDSPEICRKSPNWIPDGTVENDVMYIGGAWSIDHQWRTPGVSWWYDEECSDYQFEEFLKVYEYEKPRVLITHDAPSHAIHAMHNPAILKSSRTQYWLDEFYRHHKPEFHFYGHWHNDCNKRIDGTYFICLGELSYMDFEL